MNQLHTTIPHEEWENLVALSAIEGLNTQEETIVAEHLQGCVECRAAWTDYRHLARGISHAIPERTAPASLENRLRQRLAQEERTPIPAITRSRPRPALYPWAGLAFVLFIVGVLAWQNFQLRSELEVIRVQQDAIIALLAQSNVQPVAVVNPINNQPAGHFIWVPGMDQATLIVKGLPVLSPSRSYQLWLIREDGTVDSGGTFSLNEDGNGHLLIGTSPVPIEQYRGFAVTEEPINGSEQPSTNSFLVEGSF